MNEKANREGFIRLDVEVLRRLREEDGTPEVSVSPETQSQLVALLKAGRVEEFNHLRAQDQGWLDLGDIELEDIRFLDLREWDLGNTKIGDIELLRKMVCRHEQIKKLKFLRSSATNPIHGPYSDVYLVRCDKCCAEFEETITRE